MNALRCMSVFLTADFVFATGEEVDQSESLVALLDDAWKGALFCTTNTTTTTTTIVGNQNEAK